MIQFAVILLSGLSFPSALAAEQIAALWGSNRVSNYSSAFFLTVRAGTAYRLLFHVVDTDVEMCKSFNLKKTLYDSSTVAQIVVCSTHKTIIYSSFDKLIYRVHGRRSAEIVAE